MINKELDNKVLSDILLKEWGNLSESDKYYVFKNMFDILKYLKQDSEFIKQLRKDSEYIITRIDNFEIRRKITEELEEKYEDKLQNEINLIFGEMKRESRNEQ